MIISGHTFTKVIIGMTFMLGVLEFYIKYRLGWRPEQYDSFDEQYHNKYRQLSLGHALSRLKKTSCCLAKDLNEIDRHNIDSLKSADIKEQRHIKARIADRLTWVRNTMLHGEAHNFYDKAKYIALIYILFHLHSLKDGFRYEGI